jgi:RNA 2',3'-cyclic 3'-phosphodiesterase
MRLFIAIGISEGARQEIISLKRELGFIKGSFSRDENLHITMKFLGEVADENVENICSRLSCVAVKPFRLRLDKIGVFPNEHTPSVIWASAEPLEPQAELKKQIDLALPEFRADYPFQSHITIARIKSINADERTKLSASIRAASQKMNKIEFEVNGFTLFKSVLTKEGPVYEKIKEFSPQPL